jgi:hypothetical protein
LYVLLCVQAPTVGLHLQEFKREGAGREAFRADGRERALAPDGLIQVRRDRWPHGRPRQPEERPVMRVSLYQRISTDEDHQPTSLKTQRERLERYCEAMEDWRIVATHEDQASGTSLDRPGLQQALDLARENVSTCCSSIASTASQGRCASSPGCARNSTSSTSS